MSFGNSPPIVGGGTFQQQFRLGSGVTVINHRLNLPAPFAAVVTAQDPITGNVIALPWIPSASTADTVSVRQSAVSLDCIITIMG